MALSEDDPAIFYIDGVNPEPWEAPAASIGRKNGKVFPHLRQSNKLRDYKTHVREAFTERYPDFVPSDSDILNVTFYFWREVESVETGKGRKSRSNYADATNLQKSTEDALQGLLYHNDRQVKRVTTQIVTQGPDVEAGIVVILDFVTVESIQSGESIRTLLRSQFPTVQRTGQDNIRDIDVGF